MGLVVAKQTRILERTRRELEPGEARTRRSSRVCAVSTGRGVNRQAPDCKGNCSFQDQALKRWGRDLRVFIRAKAARLRSGRNLERVSGKPAWPGRGSPCPGTAASRAAPSRAEADPGAGTAVLYFPVCKMRVR